MGERTGRLHRRWRVAIEYLYHPAGWPRLIYAVLACSSRPLRQPHQPDHQPHLLVASRRRHPVRHRRPAPRDAACGPMHLKVVATASIHPLPFVDFAAVAGSAAVGGGDSGFVAAGSDRILPAKPRASGRCCYTLAVDAAAAVARRPPPVAAFARKWRPALACSLPVAGAEKSWTSREWAVVRWYEMCWPCPLHEERHRHYVAKRTTATRRWWRLRPTKYGVAALCTQSSVKSVPHCRRRAH